MTKQLARARVEPYRLMFGVGTSDHQCEAYQAGFDDTWDHWERDQRLVQRGRATDFWNRYQEDVDRARELGCTAFRFSVSWTRVQPSREVFSEAALDHYHDLTQAIVRAGMEPVATLLHGAWPPYVDLAGPGFPELFAAYAGRVARRLGGSVRWWLTLNEPDQFPYGYVKPWWADEYRMPPGLPPGEEPTDYVQPLMHNLFRANALARQAIKEVRPDALVSANPFLLGLPAWLQRFLDWRTRRLRSERSWRRALGRAARPRVSGRGRVDLVVGMLSTDIRPGHHADFSRPYHVTALRLLTPTGSSILGVDEGREHFAGALPGATVAVVRGSAAASRAEIALPGARVLELEDYPEALAALAAGRVAGLMDDVGILDDLAEREPGAWTVLPYDLDRVRHMVAVANGSAGLLRVADEAVDSDPGGRTDGAGAGAAAGRALDRIKRRGRLVAGVRPDLPGFLNVNDAQLDVKEISLVREIAARILGDPQRVKLVPLAVRDRIPALRGWWSRALDGLMHPVDWLLCTLNTNWWHLGMRGELPEWLCPQDCTHQQDYVALDYYWGIPTLAVRRLRELSDLAAGDYANAPVWPRALGGVLRRAARWFPGQPILLVENGCVEAASGTSRAAYLREHVLEALTAAESGVPLAGYICWSLTSNREWGLPFGPASDFGLFHIDLDGDPGLKRSRTPAAEELRRLISEARSPVI